MKRLLPLLLIASMPALAQDDGNPQCAAKADAVQKEILAAQAAGNTHRVHGLQTALQQLQANCTDADLLQEQQTKVGEAEQKVRERQAELDEEKAQGDDPAKIAKRQAKLDEANAELKQAKEALGQ